MSIKKPKVFILTNIISPYKSFLFNALNKLGEIDFKVFYVAETEKIREWKVDRNLEFSYEVMFEGKIDDVNFLALCFKTWRKLTQFKPDIIIIDGYSYSACWTAFLWAKVKSRPVILWSSSNKEDRTRGYIKENIKKFLVSRCNAANVYGTKSANYLVGLGLSRGKIFIMGNVTDNDYYYKETKKFRVKKEILCKEMNIPPRNFLYIGRFSPEKNLLFLLKSFRRISRSEKVRSWGLILVGDGPQKKEIENFIRDNNIENVFLPGFKQKEEIPKYLAVSDVFILPSVSESWGLVVNEAMAAGLPVLVSRKCGCYPDLIEEGVNGFSFDPYNVNELSKLMKEISQGRFDLSSMGKESLKKVKRYTPEKAVEVILDTINFVIEQNYGQRSN